MLKKTLIILIFTCASFSINAQNKFNLDSILTLLNTNNTADFDIRNKKIFQFYENVTNSKAPKYNTKSIKGEVINSDSLLGKVVVINFWFMACHPCMEELPLLNKVVDNYKDTSKVAFLGMSRDDSTALIQKFIPNHQFKFQIIPKTSKIDTDYCVMGFPKTFIVDKKGIVRKVYQFGISDSQVVEMIILINNYLKE